MFWTTVAPAVVAIVPPTIEALRYLWSLATSKESERKALIGALSQYKIDAWGARADLVAFDIKSQSFIPSYLLNDELAREPNTAVYVNKWILKAGAGDYVFAMKQPPGQLSSDYVFFTGKPSEIDKFVLKVEK